MAEAHELLLSNLSYLCQIFAIFMISRYALHTSYDCVVDSEWLEAIVTVMRTTDEDWSHEHHENSWWQVGLFFIHTFLMEEVGTRFYWAFHHMEPKLSLLLAVHASLDSWNTIFTLNKVGSIWLALMDSLYTHAVCAFFMKEFLAERDTSDTSSWLITLTTYFWIGNGNLLRLVRIVSSEQLILLSLATFCLILIWPSLFSRAWIALLLWERWTLLLRVIWRALLVTIVLLISWLIVGLRVVLIIAGRRVCSVRIWIRIRTLVIRCCTWWLLSLIRYCGGRNWFYWLRLHWLFLGSSDLHILFTLICFWV